MVSRTRPQPQVNCEATQTFSREAKDACKNAVLVLFPDVNHGWLDTVAKDHSYRIDVVISHIADLLENGDSYPKRVPQSRKRQRSPSSEDDGKRMARRFYGEAHRQKCNNPTYRTRAKEALEQSFPNVQLKTLNSMFVRNEYSIFRTCLAIQKILDGPNNMPPEFKLKKTATPSKGDYLGANLEQTILVAAEGERQALEEFRAARQLDRSTKDAARRKLFEEHQLVRREEENLANAKATGTVFECGCCFEEFASNRMVHCNGTELHFICKQCFASEAKRQIGLNKSEMACIATTEDCQARFSRDQILQLDSKLRIALERIEQNEAIRTAGLADLETCPFCPYAEEYPQIEVNKEFRCQNPDCGIVSCRNCRIETHIPKTCAEVAENKERQSDGITVRHAIEEAMSAAMIRKCNKCNTPFIKSLGCNKMTCTKPDCMNVQCYVCHQSCQYDHFDSAIHGGRHGNCPLFDKSVEKRHEEEVSAAEEKARMAVLAANPHLNAEMLRIEIPGRGEEDERTRKLSDAADAKGRHDAMRGQMERIQELRSPLLPRRSPAVQPRHNPAPPHILFPPPPPPPPPQQQQQRAPPASQQIQLDQPIFNFADLGMRQVPAHMVNFVYPQPAATQAYIRAVPAAHIPRAIPVQTPSFGQVINNRQANCIPGGADDLNQRHLLDMMMDPRAFPAPIHGIPGPGDPFRLVAPLVPVQPGTNSFGVPGQHQQRQNVTIRVDGQQQNLAGLQFGSQNNPINLDAELSLAAVAIQPKADAALPRSQRKNRRPRRHP